MRRCGAVVVLVWALGTVFGEGLLQLAAAAAIVAGAVAWRRARLPRDVRLIGLFAVLLCAWELLSPLLAMALGTADAMPRSGRYLQALDWLSLPGLTCLASFGVPWAALGLLLAGAWFVNVAASLYQHFRGWPFENTLLQRHVADVRFHQNFAPEGQPPRYAGTGFALHRLRFAHGAVALLGPAIAVVARDRDRRRRALAAAVIVALVAATFIAYARAALGAAVVLAALGFGLLSRGWTRRLSLAVVGAVALAVAVSPAWRQRVVELGPRLVGEDRVMAMRAGWGLVTEHPLLGVGFGNHKPAALARQAEREITEYLANDSHNYFLTVWAETGLPGLALALALHAAIAAALLKRTRAGSIAAAGGLVSFAGFHLLGLVHYLPYHSGVLLTFAMTWALGLATEIASAATQTNAPASGGDRQPAIAPSDAA